MQNKTRTLSDILADFTKAAEYEEQPTVAEVCEVCGQNPCVCECETSDDNVTASDLVDAAANVEESEDQTVDAAKELREIADEYIDKHDVALQKEAAVFGQIFARSAMEEFDAMNLEKTASEAYEYAMYKIAEAEAMEDESNIPEWLKDAIQNNSEALNEQSETLHNLVDNYSDDDELNAAAQNAYAQANEQLGAEGAEDEATPEELQNAAQGAYAQANDAIAQQNPEQIYPQGMMQQ